MPSLRALVAEELGTKADSQVVAVAEAIAAKYPDAVRAVLFYGSCLRLKQLDGLMLDFYLIVSDYRAAYGKSWLAAANALVPPNVFYFEHGGLVAKYAVLSLADFECECGPKACSTSVVARFAQPSRLVWVSDSAFRQRIEEAISSASPTLLDWTLPVSGGGSLADIWKEAFSLTFGAELRAEKSIRASAIVDADPKRYERFGLAAVQVLAQIHAGPDPTKTHLLMPPDQMARWWKRMQRKGKALSVARLAKASLTFAGGPDYIAWKINRHAGTAIALKPWQRRFPLLAVISLLPKLIRSGAIR